MAKAALHWMNAAMPYTKGMRKNRRGQVRRLMRLIVPIVVLLYSDLSLACSVACPTIEEMFSISDHVFMGKTERVEEVGINWFRDEPNIEVHFNIQKTWKGNWGNKPLRTIYNKYSCYGYFFATNEIYIMFIREGERLFLCDTQEYSDKVAKKLDEIAANQNTLMK